MECVFCDIVKGTRDSYMLYQDDLHMAFLDRYPVVPGHALVIPKSHHSTILEMDAGEVGSLFALARLLAPPILKVTGTSDFNVGQNNGQAAKQVVPHVHVHIIPRRPGDRINWNARAILDRGRFVRMAEAVRGHMADIRPTDVSAP